MKGGNKVDFGRCAVTSIALLTDESSQPTVTIFEDNFESGNLGVGWTTYTTDFGRVEVNTGYSNGGSYSLLLDCNRRGTYNK